MDIYKINGGIHPIDFNNIDKNEGQYWIIMTPKELAENNSFFEFPETTIKECIDNKQYPKLETYDKMNFGVLNILDKREDWFYINEFNFYLTDRFLVFVEHGKNILIEQIRDELKLQNGDSIKHKITISKILYSLLDKLTTMDNDILYQLEKKIDTLEERVIEGRNKTYNKDIIKIRKQLLFLKRYYEPLLSIVEDLEENENELIDFELNRFYGILANRVERLNRSVLNLRDYLTQVREAYQAQMDISLNNTMELFTVITAIFFPLSLIAGWYGMNFQYMPELSWAYGYPYVIGLSLCVVTVALIFFKKHKFL